MLRIKQFAIRMIVSVVIPLFFASILLWTENPTIAHAQSGSITGAVYHDVAGTAITNTFTTFTTPAKVLLFNSTNNGTVIMTTTTDANGHFMFTGLAIGYYYIAVDNPDELSGFSDGAGWGAVEQTYASSGNASPTFSGPICAGSGTTDYLQQTDGVISRWSINAQNKQKSGPCYGGRAATLSHVSASTLNQKKHIVKVRILSATEAISGVTFAFSQNVVTNLKNSGAGSVNMFIRTANGITGSNTMRFVPAVAPNMISGANKWWRLPLTSTLTVLPTIAGADTTLDGHAYYYRTGAVDNRNSGNVTNAPITVGVNSHSISPIERPELEILKTLGANEATFNIQGDNTTIRHLAFSTDSNQPATYHIRQTAGTGLVVEAAVMGYDMVTNNTAANLSHYGIETSYTTATAGAGAFRRNVLMTNLTTIMLSDGDSGAGNVVATTIGDWVIEDNILSDGIRLGSGTDRILIRYNKSDDAIIMAQSPTINTAVGNNTITENSLTSNNGDIIRLYEADSNLITLNVLQNAAGSGVSMTTGGEGNRITQNSFGNNNGNAIDLGDNGVTSATDCTGAGTSNGGLGRPMIEDAQLIGNILTVDVTFCNSGAFDLEFYKAIEGAGESVPPAGEGVTHVGTLLNVSGGAVTSAVITVPVSAGLTVGNKLTVLAIDNTSGNTSEFSANYALLLAIKGKVFNDLLGTASAIGPAFVGSTTADIHLYDVFGVHVNSTMLDNNGEFTFGGLTNNTYYVTLNDYRSLALGNPEDGTLLVEQSYGSAGNGAPGSGPICIGPAPTYTEQINASPSTWVAGAQNGTPSGPCYGGRSRLSSAVSSLLAPAAGSSDHAIRVIVSNANVTGVAFGFSANIVTSVGPTTTQGSLATFLKLANALDGPNTMRFVPTLPPNQSGGGSQWWRIALSGILPQITGEGTTLSGIAYNNVDGVTIRNTNNITLGVVGPVGLGNDGRDGTGDEPWLTGVNGAELELIPATPLDYGLDVNANQVAIKHIAIYGFGDATMPLPAGANNYGETGNIIIRNGSSAITVTHTILGSAANTFIDPVTTRTKGSNLIFDGSASNVVIANNLIGFANDSGILKFSKNAGLLASVNITHNEIRSNGKLPATNTQGAGVELNNLTVPPTTQTMTLANNLIANNGAQAIQLTYGRGVVIDDSKITGNGANSATSLDERQNIQLPGSQEIVIQHSIITGSVASDGVELLSGPGASPTVARQIRISQNQFGGNREQAINLVPDGITPNNGLCNEASQQNLAVDYPMITLAEINSNLLKVTGSSCTGVAGTVEIYKIAPDSGQGETQNSDIYGEGGRYLGSFAVTGGVFTNQEIPGVTHLLAGEYVTALFIDSNGNTSEFSKNAYVYSPVTLSVTPAITEGQTGQITATLGIISLNPVNVTLIFTNVTASGGDYTSQTTITIPANTKSANIPFMVQDDPTVEEDEIVQVNIAAVQNATNGATAQTILLLNNDFTSVTIAASPTLIEGTTGAITATLATTSVRTIHVTLVYSTGTTSTSDFSAATILTVPGGQLKASIPFAALSDTLVEITETLQVAVVAVENANNNSTPQSITILNDTDHDLIADGKDSDDDGDGIIDLTEGNTSRNTDGDSVPDSLDTDSDNDNIPDAIEGHDTNGDGQPDRPFAHQDADRDGLDDAFDSNFGGISPPLPDSDLDNTANYLDRDDDNDGQNTDAEDANSDSDNNPATVATDADGDHIPDYLDPDDSTTDGSGGDSDNDGIVDSREYDANQDSTGPDNTDSNGRPDYIDPDDDNDGIPTSQEKADPNGDGQPTDAQDIDKDGTADYRDQNDDNDSDLTKAEDLNSDNDGNPATTPTDADGDSIPDYLDPNDNTTGQNGGDSDGDGLRDAFEYNIDGNAAVSDDSDADLRPNYLDNDDDNDGLLTIRENGDANGDGNPVDALQSDDDGTPDFLDADSDNDKISDGAEYDVNLDTFGPDDSDSDGKSDYRDTDDDNDNVPTAQENPDPNGDKSPADAQNVDSDALPDYLDKDDDNDGENTITEDLNSDQDQNPATNPKDADSDNVPDYLDPNDDSTDGSGGDSDEDTVNDVSEFGNGAASGGIHNGAQLVGSVMAAALDTDGDGKPNYWDADDDNDTLPTSQEIADGNTDQDASSNYLDNDDDNDGKLTATEVASGDADGDRIVDHIDPQDTPGNSGGGDSDSDGLKDASEFDSNGDNSGPDDSNNNGVANYVDADDDGDGIPTNAENADLNGDGNPADARDTDGDGTVDYLDANNSDGLQADNDSDGVKTGDEDRNGDGNIHNDDTDGDSTPNYRDSDDDGDTVPTLGEDVNTDGNPANDNTDGDDKPNYLDADDDNDGILTKDEDANGNGNLADDDADKDGKPNYLDADSTADFDGDGQPNNVDSDDDNDGVTDAAEGNGSVDTDSDGAADWQDIDDDNDGVETKTESALGDTDGDQTPNHRDRDDDGDGLDTTTEDRNGDKNPANDDSDSDGKANYLDNDDDNDGILTKLDNTGLDPADTNLADDDTDGDGTPNYLDNDDDGDSVPTAREDLNNDGNLSNDDTDSDGKANALDADDDGDGILTKAEDLNGNGDPTDDDSNGNGIADYLEKATSGPGEPGKYTILLPVIRTK